MSSLDLTADDAVDANALPDPDALTRSAQQALDEGTRATRAFAQRLPGWLTVAHWFFIVNLVAQMLYVGFQVFVVLQPEGTVGPMFLHARSLDPEVMMLRRMYAIEGWIAFLGLSLYLGVTEILPRRWPRPER